MRFSLKIIVPVLAVALTLTNGCTDRGTNDANRAALQEGSILDQQGAHVFFNEFILQLRNKFHQLEFVAYVPKVSFPSYLGGDLRPVPLLILLPPQDGDHFFYFNHGLKEIADELISEGTIQPMTIVCISNDKVFGGYFFGGHSPAAGDYDTLIGGTMVDYLHQSFLPFAINDSLKRGIGGVGMGAYGAFRAAMLHPGTFSSISAVDGPLDFDGAGGSGGFVNLFDDVVNEQLDFYPIIDTTYLVCDRLIDTTFFVCDSLDTIVIDSCISYTEYAIEPSAWDSIAILDTCISYTAYDIEPLFWDSTIIDTNFADWYNRFDSSGTLHLSRLFIGGSLAFSPHDTSVTWDVTFNSFTGEQNINILSRQSITDSATIVTSIIKVDQNNFDFHLPFDSTGSKYDPIWDMWLNNNLENILNSTSNQLNGVDIWVASSPEASFGAYYEQTQSWINTLTSAPYNYPVTTKTYTGYSGNPAVKDQYIYDLIREMLIFHSNSFGE
ncbi:MAG: alpha/beta hydrolase-fold protein [Candidatus Zixiibacteriota bacterium]